MEKDYLTLGIDNESDRGVIIVAHAHLDDCLKQICETVLSRNKIAPDIVRKLVSNRSDDGPPILQSFWTKLTILHGFGFVPRHIYDGLVAFNTLRNHAGAHSAAPCTLKEKDVRKIIAKLDPGLADYITGMGEYGHNYAATALKEYVENPEIWKGWEAAMKRLENHTLPRKLLEAFVLVIDGVLGHTLALRIESSGDGFHSP